MSPGPRPPRGARAAPVLATAPRTALLAALLATLHACLTSPAPRDAARADSPYGSVVTVRLLDGRRYAGELLAVQESSLVVVTGSRIAVGRLTDVARIDWSDYTSSYDVSTAVWTSRKIRERGRLASRFPFGPPDPVLRALLARYGQTAPDTLRPGPR